MKLKIGGVSIKFGVSWNASSMNDDHMRVSIVMVNEWLIHGYFMVNDD